MNTFYQPLASLESCGDVEAPLEPRTKLLSVRFLVNASDWSVIRRRLQSAHVAAIWGLTFYRRIFLLSSSNERKKWKKKTISG